MVRRALCSLLLALLVWPARLEAGVAVFPFRGGAGWAAVVILPEGPAIVRSNDAAVLLETPARVVWATALFRPVLYLRAAYCGGEVRAVGQDHDSGQLIEITARGTRAFGPTFGQNATAIACVGGRFLAYVQFSPTEIAVSDLDTMQTDVVTVAHTSQGIRDVLPTGEIRLGDAWQRIPNQYGHGRSIHQPVERGGIYVGQNSTGAGILAILPDRVFTTIPGDAHEPDEELFDGGFAIAARVQGLGAALAIVTHPFPPHETIDPPPPPPPPPPQLPACAAGGDGLRDGIVVDVCQWFFAVVAAGRPATQWEAVLNERERELWAKGIGLQRGSPGPGPTPGRQRGRFFLPTAICPNAAPPADEEHWGVRQDVRCWDELGRKADMISADGQQWIWNEGGPQAYVPFTGGTIDPPPPPPPPPPDLVGRVAALERTVAALEVELRRTQAAHNGLQAVVLDLGARITTLEQRPSGGLTPEQQEGVRQLLEALRVGLGLKTGTTLPNPFRPHDHPIILRWEPVR